MLQKDPYNGRKDEKQMKYQVLIEETIVQAFDVEASSEEEAMDIAASNYRSGDFVLEDASVTSCMMSVDGKEWRDL